MQIIDSNKRSSDHYLDMSGNYYDNNFEDTILKTRTNLEEGSLNCFKLESYLNPEDHVPLLP